MSNKGLYQGFTFVELVVVVSIISILLVFSVPLFRDLPYFSSPRPKVSVLVNLIQSLKQNAVIQNRDFFLHIEPHAGLVWTSDTAMDDTARELAKQKAMVFDRDVTIVSVELPGPRESPPETVRLHFLKQGYSDRALVHLRESDEDVTLRISAFLSEVERYYQYVSYDDCI